MSRDDRGERGDPPAGAGDDRPDPDSVRAALGRLAGADGDDVVDRAEAAVEDLELAVEFVETAGLDGLEAAIAETDDPERETRGERALATFRRFRAAANGELDDADPPNPDAGHFHRGRGTDLRRDGEARER